MESNDRLARLKAALRCDPVDRPPYGFWTHLPGIDLDPLRLAEETAAFADRFDMDFIKSMPNGFYMAQAWGCPVDFSEIPKGGVGKVVVDRVQAAADWTTLGTPSLAQPDLARELDHLEALVKRVGPSRPVLATVFSPLTSASKLSGTRSVGHASSDGAALHAGLEAITEVTCAFARAAIERGCAGVFLALQDATSDAMDAASYRVFGEPYDLRVLAAARAAGSWFDAIHAHGENILFELLAGYPVDALNWHIGETPPAVSAYLDGQALGGRAPSPRRAILGGLQRTHITKMDRLKIQADLDRAFAETGGRGLLVAPACVIRHPVDDATLHWIAAQVRGMERKSGSDTI